jgi:uncharacterized repeat protein (TIGR03803 family)
MKNMFQIARIFRILLTGLALAVCYSISAAKANQELVLHRFNGIDGSSPYAGLIRGSDGNLYGTTAGGGTYGWGAVFKIAPDGTESVLYSFTGGSDGASPYASLLRDNDGNIYGTTSNGGTTDSGVVYKLASDGTETMLYSFSGESDGAYPFAALTRDPAGNFYSTTASGGVYGRGVVFKLAPDGTYAVLHSFAGGHNDGNNPYGGVVRDAEGNLYGTLSTGGPYRYGLVYKLAPDGRYTVLHAFGLPGDGAGPFYGTLIRDAAGNLYGATPNGGAYSSGTIFKIAPDRTETVLYSLRGGQDGRNPNTGLAMDALGNLYGPAHGGGVQDFGVIFKLAPDGTYSVLHAFAGGSDGGYPYGTLVVSPSGTLFGTTSGGTGGSDAGTVFKIKN